LLLLVIFSVTFTDLMNNTDAKAFIGLSIQIVRIVYATFAFGCVLQIRWLRLGLPFVVFLNVLRVLWGVGMLLAMLMVSKGSVYAETAHLAEHIFQRLMM
jgi:hypothetical protein